MKGKLEQILHETTVNLVRVSIFYFPESFVDLLNIPKTKEVMVEINKLFLIDKEGFSLNPKNTKTGMFILSKKRFLDENILLLYDFKEKNSKGGFEYVVEKYGELVKSFLYLSEWLLNNVDSSIDKITKDQNTALSLQHQYFFKHKQEFEKKFCIELPVLSSDESSTKVVLSKIKPIMPNLNKRFVKKTTNRGLDKREHIKQLKEATKTNAEKYLLETVFGLKINKKQN